MGKKAKGKAGDYWDEEFEGDQPQAEEFGTPAAQPAAEPSAESKPETSGGFEVAAPEDEFPEDDFLSALRKTKKKKEKKVDEEPAAEAKPVVQLKSKKEKEKEKKEREKQKKKEKEKAKKAAQQAAQQSAKSAASSADASATPAASAGGSAPAPAATGKKVPAHIAALQKRLAAQKALEEEKKRLEEEELQRLEEEEKKAAEEEKAKEEARLRKKEREKQKREEKKAAGLLLTKKQKEQKRLMEKRREDLLQSGVVVEGLQADSKPKKPVYGKKKKNDREKTASVEPEATPEPEKAKEPVKEPAKEPAAEAQAAEEDDEDVLESWEAALSDEEPTPEEAAAAAEREAEEKAAREAAEAAAREAEERAARQAEADAAKEAAERAAAAREAAPKKIAKSKRADKNLRSPICCILGHVDTGKTKLLDKIRQTNVQEGEAGGITQQIGATYFPIEAIEQKTQVMAQYESMDYTVPGLLIIDTPGHESFSNLRSRGSSLCNIAILVIDITHGLEQQTLESIRLLRDRKTPFIVALNKIDRLYGWETIPNNAFRDSLARQNKGVLNEFKDRLDQIKLALAEQGLNSELYYQNKNMAKFVSIVPTSAVTGEGVPDLLWLLLELTQKRMSKQLMYLSSIEATILEVKVVEGLGTTIDVILSNGVLKEGDRIVLCGLNGPIATNIRALLTPQPLRELRIKSAYVHHKEVKAALGVKIAANDLEKAVAGSRLLVVGPDDDEEDLMDDVMEDLTGLLDSVDSSGRGVTVQASTLGALEALLDFLKDMKIPVMSIGIGPVFKRDVMKAAAMLDKAKEFAVMLCFDVRIDKEAEQYAEEQGVKIFSADIIYHLFDEFTAHQKKLLEEKRKDNIGQAIFPCVLHTLQIINKRNPMIIGVDVVEGSVRIGTPIGAVKIDPVTKQKQILNLGKVVSLEVNHKPTDIVKKGQTNQGVAMRLDNPSAQQPVWGRHVDEKDTLYSLITRRSIDTLKDPMFRDTVAREDWLLMKNLKPVLDIE